MYTKEQISEKIRRIYPDIERCSISLNVDFDRINNFWVVSVKKDNRELSAFLDDSDASACIHDNLCTGLDMQISQLRKNIKKIGYC
jgi:predicted transport protein